MPPPINLLNILSATSAPEIRYLPSAIAARNFITFSNRTSEKSIASTIAREIPLR
jgi:hypothetical protein